MRRLQQKLAMRHEQLNTIRGWKRKVTKLTFALLAAALIWLVAERVFGEYALACAGLVGILIGEILAEILPHERNLHL